MSETPVKYDADPAVVDQLIRGDVSNVPRDALLRYVFTFCERTGISALAVPFSLMKTQKGTFLVANRNFYDAVAAKYAVSRECIGEGFFEGSKLYFTRYRASTPDGRVTEDIALVDTANLSGDQLANAIMKCHTKGRNRVTRAHLGFPFPDETEAETVEGAKVMSITEEQGNGTPEPPPAPPEPPPPPNAQQIQRLHGLAHKLQMNEAAYRQLLQERFGVRSSKQLTAEQAAELIRELTALLKEREQQQAHAAEQQEPEQQAEPEPQPQDGDEQPSDTLLPVPEDSRVMVSPVDANAHLESLGIPVAEVRAWRKAWVEQWGDGMAFNRIAVQSQNREEFLQAMRMSGVRISTAVS